MHVRSACPTLRRDLLAHSPLLRPEESAEMPERSMHAIIPFACRRIKWRGKNRCGQITERGGVCARQSAGTMSVLDVLPCLR
ncbi:hypothetical protein E2C01_090687 [Portunus trituberculatus]|uniref:Uncharacterized protein n=1 Tax=Portunus trituberculatus TaxID=210409 RepID=A0A5B7JM08_PORTR|nr:hypothetical protein [Portunus trituberculatus]